MPFTLRIEVLKRSTLEEWGDATLWMDRIALQAELLGTVSCGANSLHHINVPTRIIVEHHGIPSLQPMGIQAEFNLTDNESPGSMAYVLVYRERNEAPLTGESERLAAAEQVFEAWVERMVEAHQWMN
jgi:hypothetical protein